MIRVANLLSSDLDGLADGIRALLQSSRNQPVALQPAAGPGDFRDGRLDLVLICGLAYALIHDAAPERFTAVAAPVVDDPRSGGAPVYFSEIVVASESPARSLEDLRGRRFAYNETLSFSGFRALEHELRTRGSSWEYFGERLRTGSHHASLAAVRRGSADAAAIDSHVLLMARRRDPGLAAGVKVIESLGPYPSPPVAVNRHARNLSGESVNEVLDRLPAASLRTAAVRRWEPVDDAYYDAIRAVTRASPGLGM